LFYSLFSIVEFKSHEHPASFGAKLEIRPITFQTGLQHLAYTVRSQGRARDAITLHRGILHLAVLHYRQCDCRVSVLGYLLADELVLEFLLSDARTKAGGLAFV